MEKLECLITYIAKCIVCCFGLKPYSRAFSTNQETKTEKGLLCYVTCNFTVSASAPLDYDITFLSLQLCTYARYVIALYLISNCVFIAI